MVWSEWWPHDPVPQSKVTDPYLVKTNPQQVYWWCACGLKFKPVMYVPQNSGRKLMCGCKYSCRRPFCDGSHLWVKAHKNMPKAALGTFGFFFTFGVFTSWILHP
uniref:Iron-binding zinc finger CDGSH type, putative n=1 Tax=Theileria annulata TaxID=5874 RepID=A0A3B0MMK0_THEAN